MLTSDNFMAADLAKLKAIAEAATPGPWREIERCDNAHDDESCGVTSEQKTKYGHTVGIFKSDAYDECRHPVIRTNAAYIAASSPDVVLALIGECERLRAWPDVAVAACAKRRCSTLERDRNEAEAERDALRADVERLREELRVMTNRLSLTEGVSERILEQLVDSEIEKAERKP